MIRPNQAPQPGIWSPERATDNHLLTSQWKRVWIGSTIVPTMPGPKKNNGSFQWVNGSSSMAWVIDEWLWGQISWVITWVGSFVPGSLCGESKMVYAASKRNKELRNPTNLTACLQCGAICRIGGSNLDPPPTHAQRETRRDIKRHRESHTHRHKHTPCSPFAPPAPQIGSLPPSISNESWVPYVHQIPPPFLRPRHEE